VLHRFGVHFGNNQRQILVHPKYGAIVYHHRTPIHRSGAELLADGAAGAEERDVDAVQAIRGELLQDVVPVLEDDAAAGGALQGQHFDGSVGEVVVGEELLANGAGDADDGDGGAVIAEGHSDPGGPRGGLWPCRKEA